MQPKLQFTRPTAFTIKRIETENYRTVTLVLDGKLDAYPGQFVMAWLPRFDEKPFSLVNADPITLMITAVGPFSRLVHQLQPGDKLWLRGPMGRGFQQSPANQRLALIGGGYGVAPLLWLAQSAIAQGAIAHGNAMTAVIGARTAADLLYLDRFQQLASTHPNLSVIATTEDGSAGITGRVTDAILPLVANHALDAIYACGPHAMLGALQTLGEQHQLACQLSWEAYMRCGIGICGSCEHVGHVLCLDGPVLSHPQMAHPALSAYNSLPE